MSRPEHVAPPEMFYSGEEARKYATNSRMREIQSTLSERAMELLALDGENKMILDVGCGSGLSGEVITEHGHQWIGCDISHDMLKVAVEQEVEGDVVVNDMGQGLPFRPGSFDGCISISAVQWLCNAEGSHSNPHRRLLTFFTSLFRCLVRGGRAVLQWYPENVAQMDLVTTAAMRCGFGGGLLVDYPNSTRAKKYFLVLFAGHKDGTAAQKMPQAMGAGEQEHVANESKRNREKNRKGMRFKGGIEKGSKKWINAKKDRQRAQGKAVPEDSKYTGRKRRPKF